MGLQMRGIHHHRVGPSSLGGQFQQHPREDPHPAPADPAVVERLRRAVDRRRIPPAQAIAIDKDYPAQNLPVIDPRLATRLREKRPQPRHLLVRQPKEIAHHAPHFGSLNHAVAGRSSRFMGPEPSSCADRVKPPVPITTARSAL